VLAPLLQDVFDVGGGMPENLADRPEHRRSYLLHQLVGRVAILIPGATRQRQKSILRPLTARAVDQSHHTYE
jgi:hypothetical protein